jgi:hypothetical protein
MQLSLSAVGLIADIIGVIFIGLAFLNSDARNLLGQARETLASSGYHNPVVLTSLCEQKVDNIFGFTFLLFGFVFQLISALHLEPSWRLDWVALAAVLIAALASFLFRRGAVRYYERKALAVGPSNQAGLEPGRQGKQ